MTFLRRFSRPILSGNTPPSGQRPSRKRGDRTPRSGEKRRLRLESLESRRLLATILVTTAMDENDGTFDPGLGTGTSLREAIIAANLNPEPTTITFDPSLNGTPILLTIIGADEDAALTGDLDISREITIIGNGPSNSIIDGGARLDNEGNVITPGIADRVFDVQLGGNLTLQATTVTGGNTTGDGGNDTGQGGGVYIRTGGTVTITGSTLSGNSARYGGGFSNSGTATITESILSGNSADVGGGVDNAGAATITDSTLSGNSASEGGGVRNVGDLTLTDVTVGGTEVADGNTAADNGGGLFADALSNTTVNGGRFQNNVAGREGGGLWNGTGTMTIQGGTAITENTANSSANTFNDQGGGGIFNGGGSLQLIDAFLNQNTASIAGGRGGGLLSDGGVVSVSGTEVMNNDRYGLALINGVDAMILSNTFSGNVDADVLLSGTTGDDVFNVTATSISDGIRTTTIDSTVGVFRLETLDGFDTVNVSGDLNGQFQIDGGDPSTSPGDVLNLDALNNPLTISGPSLTIAGTAAFTPTNFETVNFANVTEFTIEADANSNQIDVFVNGPNTEVVIDGQTVFSQPTLGLVPLVINGADGDDVLTIDYSNGNPLPAGGLTFDGGVGGNDSLELRGGSVSSITHTFDNASDGSIDLAGSIVRYVGLEPIIDNMTTNFRTFDFPGPDAHAITLGNDPNIAGNNFIDSPLSESVSFASAGITTRINAGDGDDTITITTLDASDTSGLEIDGGGGTGDQLIMTGVNIDTGGFTRGLRLSELEVVNVFGGTIGNNESDHGGGIHLINSTSGTDTTATITGVTFSNNRAFAAMSGGGIANDGANLTIDGSTFLNNSTNGNGGGVFQSGGSLTITNSTFTGNAAALNGGGIYVFGGSLLIAGSTIGGNTTGDSGGGVYAAGAALTLSDSTIASNNANGSDSGGGGVYLLGGGTTSPAFSITNTDFTLNTANSGGGGLEIVDNPGSISGGVYADNTVNGGVLLTEGGGGIVIISVESVSSPAISIDGVTIRNNNAPAGGGIALVNPNLTISNSLIELNRANMIAEQGGLGGGIAATGDSEGGRLSIFSTDVRNNVAEADGGGIAAGGIDLIVTDTNISTNQADGQAGGIGIRATSFAPTLTLNRVTVDNNLADFDGGGIGAINTNLDFINVTVTNNESLAGTGGGLFYQNFGSFGSNSRIAFSTFASNVDPSLNSNIDAEGSSIDMLATLFADGIGVFRGGFSFNSLGHNVNNSTPPGLTDPTDVISTDVSLLPLGDFGGPVPTRPASDPSAILNRVPAALSVSVDARGVPRSGSTSDLGDVGAFEFFGVEMTPANVTESDGAQVVPVNLDRSIPFEVTLSNLGISENAVTSLAQDFIFAAGESTTPQSFEFTILDDEIVESDVVQLVGFTSTAGPVIGSLTLANIADDDTTTLDIVDVSVVENAGFVTISVISSTAVDRSFLVDYATSDGTATAPGDYLSASGTLIFAGTAGEIQTFDVSIVDDDINETVESFTISLSNLRAADETPLRLGGFIIDDIGTVTINDDDDIPLTLGGEIFVDNGGGSDQAEQNNGLRDFVIEPVFQTVLIPLVVELYTSDPSVGGLIPIASTSVDPIDGSYSFPSLTAGTYFVLIPESEFTSGPLLGFIGSQIDTPGNGGEDVTDDNVDNDNDGVFVPGVGFVSGAITLVVGDEPTEGIINTTVDFGVVPTTDLRIDNMLTTTDPVAGGEVSFELTIANLGGTLATGISAESVLPANLTTVIIRDSLGSPVLTTQTPEGDRIVRTFDVPDLDAGVSVIYTVSAILDSAITIDPQTEARVTGFEVEFDDDPLVEPLANNVAVETVAVTRLTDVSITKQVLAPDQPAAGGLASYQVIVENTGPSDARGVEVVDLLPAGLTFFPGDQDLSPLDVSVSPDGRTLTFTLPDLPAGGLIAFSYQVAIASDQTQTLVNSVSVSTTDPDSDLTNNSASVFIDPVRLVDLVLDVQANTLTAVPGLTELTYTYTVSHDVDSLSDASAITLTDLLPAGLSVVSIEAPGAIGEPAFDPLTRVLSVDFDSIPVGQTRVMTVTATVDADATGSLTNAGNVTVSGIDEIDLSNNSDSVTVTLTTIILPDFLQLSTGDGEGDLMVFVDALGNLGSSDSDALDSFNPVGPTNADSTIFRSSMAARFSPSGPRQFFDELTSNDVSVNNFTGSSTVAESVFRINGIDVSLTQSVSPTFNALQQRLGARLDQVYVLSNPSLEPITIDLIRYLDPDLEFDGSIDDGGGVINEAGQPLVLFATDRGGRGAMDTTFVGIEDSGGVAPLSDRFMIEDFVALENRVRDGSPLENTVDEDSDNNGFVDLGAEYDVALAMRRVLTIQPGESATYTTTTLFGGQPRDAAITGHVYCDANGNGREDFGETTAGQRIFIDTNGNGRFDEGEIEAFTDSSGNYRFDTLPTGTQRVTLIVPSGCAAVPENFATAALSLEIGQTVRDILTADFNGDGQDDLLSVSDRQNQLFVNMPRSTGNSFTTIDVPQRPQAVDMWRSNQSTSPFAHLAVASVGGGQTTENGLTRPNRGAMYVIEDMQPTAYDMGDGPIDVLINDFNGDGSPDYVAAAFRSGEFHIRLSHSNAPGVVGARQRIAQADGAFRVVAGHFNDDDHLDLALGGYGFGSDAGTVQIFFGDGTGKFDPGPSLTTRGKLLDLSVSPMLGGNQPIQSMRDALVVLSSEVARDSGFSSNNRPSFVTSYSVSMTNLNRLSEVTLPSGASKLEVGDLNADGHDDLAVVRSGANEIDLLLGDGSGNFEFAKSTGQSIAAIDIAFGDLEGSGVPGLVIAEHRTQSSSGSSNSPSDGTTLFRLRADQKSVVVTANAVSQANFQPSTRFSRFDVDDNQQVTALDALLVINAIEFPPSSAAQGEPSSNGTLVVELHQRTDVNGDGKTTALDALQIINYLNSMDETSSVPTEKTRVGGEPLMAEVDVSVTDHDDRIRREQIDRLMSESSGLF